MIETINKIIRTSKQMAAELGYEPTPAEIANKLSMPLDTFKAFKFKIIKPKIFFFTSVWFQETMLYIK